MLGFLFFNNSMLKFTKDSNDFILYNSYIRNFNGYNDEKIDNIITCNEQIIKDIENRV
jgi:hypothetical protein